MAESKRPEVVTTIIVLTLAALLAYNIIVVGPKGIPTNYILGGLLGAYLTGDRLIKMGKRDDDEDPT